MGSFKEYLRRKSDEGAKKRYERSLLLAAGRAVERIDQWPKWAENDDSILQLLHHNEHVPTKEFTTGEIDEIRSIFDSISSLTETVKPPQFYRGNENYLGVKIVDPWRERYDYLALEAVPDREILARFVEGVSTLYNGDTVEWYVDVDRKLEKRLLEILFRHDQRKYFTMRGGENYIDI